MKRDHKVLLSLSSTEMELLEEYAKKMGCNRNEVLRGFIHRFTTDYK